MLKTLDFQDSRVRSGGEESAVSPELKSQEQVTYKLIKGALYLGVDSQFNDGGHGARVAKWISCVRLDSDFK